MAYVGRNRVTMVDSTGGGSTQYSAVANGYISSIAYTTIATAISTTAVLTITAEASGEPILTVTTTGTKTWYPRGQTNSVTGALTYETTAATSAVQQGSKIPLADERVKFVLGATTAAGLTGRFDVYIDGNWTT